jgi:ADP-dependent NAD(P)H-hydrate dehydratase / NAD(P)H-hydrate epimerase
MSTKILTAQQMREVDRVSTEQFGVPAIVLMENAGRSVVELMAELLSPLQRKRIAIVCGKGNNGGDGFVIARHLLMRGIRPRVVLFADPTSLNGEARINYESLVTWGLSPLLARNQAEWAAARTDLLSATVVVDAVLGMGIDRPLEGFLADVIVDLSALLPHAKVIAVDIPSGLTSDTGAMCGPAMRAHHTITFSAPKLGHIFPPNCEYVGELHVVPIGTPPTAYRDDAKIFLNLLSREDVAPFLAARSCDSHKGNFGHVLIVGGSRGKSGAAAMAGMSALRSGAGLVTVASAKCAQAEVALSCPALMTESIEESTSGNVSEIGSAKLGKLLEGKSVVAVGPGIGSAPDTIAFVRALVRDTANIPLVLDADGLNAFSTAPELLDGTGRTLVLTPHPGEMARLTGVSSHDVQARRIDVARDFAIRRRVCLVLKGSRTLIAEPGGQVYVNPTGNPGMATAGSGDVLTGMIAAMLAQFPSEPVEKVVSAAVYWHGSAGDEAVRSVGEHSLIATDLINALPHAAKALKRGRALNG